jgi:hypothetical protein
MEKQTETPPSTPFRWVRLAKYCRETGDTPNAVHARRRKHQWIDGVHCLVGPDGNLWINSEEVTKWLVSLFKSSNVLAA